LNTTKERLGVKNKSEAVISFSVPDALKSPLVKKKDIFTYKYSLPLEYPQKKYKLIISWPNENFTVGSLIELSISIQKLVGDDISMTEMFCELTADSKNWLFSGKKKHQIAMANERTSFNCKIKPLTEGYLPLPQIRVSGINMENIILEQKEQYIAILSKASNTLFFDK